MTEEELNYALKRHPDLTVGQYIRMCKETEEELQAIEATEALEKQQYNIPYIG